MNLMMGETYLKQMTIINDNVDMKIITPTIEDVQRLYVEDVLGTQLFNQILSQIGSSSVSSANQTLLDSYILPFMKYYVLMEVSPVFKLRYMNKGLMVKSSENSQPASQEEMLYIMDRWRDNAQKLANKCTDYLRDNTATYPLFLTNYRYYESQPNQNNFSSGFYTKDRNDDYPCSLRGIR
jgi:hypothetical protein